MSGKSSTGDMHQYDKIPCDYCGETIQQGHTTLHSGQVVHHGCAEEMLDQ